MPSNADRLRAAFDASDLDQLMGLLDEGVIWRGLPTEDHVHADDDQQHEHDDVPICRSRAEVRAVFEGVLAEGHTGHPVILAEAGDSVVVDPRPEPALPFPLHQAFTFRGGRVVLIQDFPDRDSALADLGAYLRIGQVE